MVQASTSMSIIDILHPLEENCGIHTNIIGSHFISHGRQQDILIFC